MSENTFLPKLRKWSRSLHRDLSYFFSGVILIYAASGFMLNHKSDFNSNYSISVHNYTSEGSFPVAIDDVDDDFAVSLLKKWDKQNEYTQYYFPEDTKIKVFTKGGSSVTMDITDGSAVYESVEKRIIPSALNRLHYNPTRWWTWFSDAFILSLVVITLTGLIMVKGPKGLWGRGGIELIIGILIPLLFVFLS
ncbi:MAG: PepSY-associated TM helix domain-containing protein [Flavobacteriales bacterium]|nr:PepSY-associated TM helix domain-containing protein [Flavobacteriales bacterium]